ncbi:MAG: lasso peptide biosynthesis B2 protein [Syntrophobacteraceae bacterium]
MKKALRIALAVHVWIIAAIIPLLVRVLSLKRILEVFTPSPLFQPYRGMSAEDMAGVVKNRLQRPVYMVRRACLRGGLLMFHFLRLAGFEATLHISVHPREVFGRFHAHLWVTLSGRTVSSPPGLKMAELFSYPLGG